MSDEEPQDVGMPDDDDMSGDDMPGDYPGAGPQLPEGVNKEILTPAPDSNWKQPKVGDDVTVHYVGTLESDGSEFDSSRARDKPFTFALGRGQVIKGWDLGVATMKKGEVAKFTLAPEFAYGEEGSPPKIPAKATLVFEVELISWCSKDDLFSDEGVIKMEVKEGSGWKKPKEDDEILVTFKVTDKEGNVIEEKANTEYKVGSGLFGDFSKAVDKALLGMKKGEEAQLACTEAYSRPGGATIHLTLLELFETTDCSFSKNGSLMKKQVKEGEGYDTPKDASDVNLSVEAATDGASPIAGFVGKNLEFVSGNGDVCDALEFVAEKMKKGERAIVTCTKPSALIEEKLGLTASLEKVVLTVELVSFEKGKDTWSMSEEEKIDFGVARKDVGSNLFRKGRTQLALRRYEKVADLFNYIDNFKEENKVKAKELKKACELNRAACHLKLDDPTSAKKSCDTVLKDDSLNVKALFRRAQAEEQLKNYDSCIRDLKKVLDIDAQNKDARLLLKKARAGQKEDDQKSKGLFQNMCNALGKLPTPAPPKPLPKEPSPADFDDINNPEAFKAAQAAEAAEAAPAAEAPAAEVPAAEASAAADGAEAAATA